MEPDLVPARVVVVQQSADEVGEVYAHACAPLIGLLSAIGGNRADAEEVAQESFVRLLEHWPKVREYDDAEAWLRRVAVRMLISRHRRRQVAALGLRRLAARSELARQAEATGEPVDIAQALAGLPLTHRAVLILHHVCDLPVDEVARQLDIPVGTVKSRLSRARAAMAVSLTDESRSAT